MRKYNPKKEMTHTQQTSDQHTTKLLFPPLPRILHQPNGLKYKHYIST